MPQRPEKPLTESAQAETTPAARSRERKAHPPLKNIVAVAAGGAIGASLRYGFIQAFPTDAGAFPLTIFMENIIGAFLLGLILTLVLERWRLRWDIRPFLTTGILGSFTTFSNLSLDIMLLGWGGWPLTALACGVGGLGIGLAAALLGITTARRLFGRYP